VAQFLQWLKKNERAGFDTHIVLGNHDVIRTGSKIVSALDVITAAEFLRVRVHKAISHVDYPGMRFTFLPFRDRRIYDADSPEAALKRLEADLDSEWTETDSVKVCVGHMALKGSIPIGYELDSHLNEIICPLEFFSRFNIALMGHVHRPQLLGAVPHVSHIGSMCRSKFSEEDMKGNKVLGLIEGGRHEVQFLPLPARALRHVKLTVPEATDPTAFSMEQLKDHEGLAECVLRLDLSMPPGEWAVDRTRLVKFLESECGVHHVAVITESRVAAEAEAFPLLLERSAEKGHAIKTYAESLDLPTEDHTAFLDLALSCFDEFKGAKQ